MWTDIWNWHIFTEWFPHGHKFARDIRFSDQHLICYVQYGEQFFHLNITLADIPIVDMNKTCPYYCHPGTSNNILLDCNITQVDLFTFRCTLNLIDFPTTFDTMQNINLYKHVIKTEGRFVNSILTALQCFFGHSQLFIV